MTTDATHLPPLQYANPSVLRPKFDLYRATVACGAVPLITGGAVFTLWYATRWRWLQELGLFVIFAGTVAFAAGCAMLLLHVRSRVRTAIERPTRFLARAALATILLLVNFPVAFVCCRVAWFLESQHAIAVTNAGSATIDSFIVTGPGINHEFGPIQPGNTSNHAFQVTTDGELTFSMTVGQTASSGIVEGYVTNDLGGDTRVTVNATNVTVRNRRHAR